MTQSTKLDHWRELFLLYRVCHLSVADFCQQHQVRVHQFYYWRAKICTPPAASGSALVPLHFPATESSKQTHDVRIHLPNGVELSGLGGEQLHALLPELATL